MKKIIDYSKSLKEPFLFTLLTTILTYKIYTWSNLEASSSTRFFNMYLDWEKSIPLVPWMIIPYMSLFLVFPVAMFVIKNSKAIRACCYSLMVSSAIAAIFFVLLPGKLGFERTHVDGYDSIYKFLFSIDLPHNLYPSLHVAFSWITIKSMIEEVTIILFQHFLRFWLFLIIISVVLVHQHHLFDIVTGLILAVLTYQFLYRKIRHTETISEKTI